MKIRTRFAGPVDAFLFQFYSVVLRYFLTTESVLRFEFAFNSIKETRTIEAALGGGLSLRVEREGRL